MAKNVIRMSCVEAVEAFQRGGQRDQIFSRQFESMFVGMMLRSESEGLSGLVQFDVAAQDMGEGPRLQKLDNPQSAFPICRGIVNQEPARHKEIAGKKKPRLVVVE